MPQNKLTMKPKKKIQRVKQNKVKGVCALGFACRATKLKHFIDFWHIPTKFSLPTKKPISKKK